MKIYPLIRMVEPLGGNLVRIFFAYGKTTKVVEMRLPWVKSAAKAHVVDEGMGLDPGDGLEVSGYTLWGMPKRIIRATQGRSLPKRRTSKRRTSRKAA